jgi:hypothetical protein
MAKRQKVYANRGLPSKGSPPSSTIESHIDEEKKSYPTLEASVAAAAAVLTAEREKERLQKQQQAEWKLRVFTAILLVGLFVAANVLTFLGMMKAWDFDAQMLKEISNNPEVRVFNKEVLIALIAATTAQLGIIAVIVSKWLFKS